MAVALTVAIAAWLAMPGAASAARKRVVVLPFEGQQADAAQEEVANVIKRKHAIVPAESYQKAARKLGVKGESDDAIASVARQLGVDAVVLGQVKRKGGKWELDIKVRDGGNGGIVEQIVIPLRSPKIDQEATERIAPELMPALLRADGNSAGRGETEGEAAGEAGGEGEGESAPVVKKPKKKKHRASSDDGEEGGDEGGDEGGEDGAGGWLALHMLSASAGLTFVGRSFQYDNADLQAYGSGLSPGIILGGESFPLQSMGGVLANIGIGAMFATEPFNKAKLGDVTSAVTQRRWYIDARYALKLSDSFMLVPFFGVGNHSFAIQKADGDLIVPSDCTKSYATICLADVFVMHLRLGTAARVPLSPTMMLTGEISVMPAISVAATDGQIASEAADTALGFGLSLGLAYKLTDNVALQGMLTFERFGHSFGAFDATNTYASAVDSYFGGNVGAMFSF